MIIYLLNNGESHTCENDDHNSLWYMTIQADRIVRLTATGKALDHIKEKFRGLPMRHFTNKVVWYGDDAKFIVTNYMD